MLHTKASVLLLASDPISKLTNFSNISDDGNDFNGVSKFDISLVNRNPQVFKTVIILLVIIIRSISFDSKLRK